ncbi:MAG: hypothetical protein F6K47_43995 [Symploca sp. SIO2E6]|nr:hypothetical protein [Symploca sp. SIO2E6]
MEISAKDWGNLCTQDNLWLYAKELTNVCEKAVELQPDNPFFLYNLGLAYAIQDKVDVAIIKFQKALNLISEIQARDENSQKELDSAIYQIKKIIKELRSGKNPTTTTVLLWQGSDLAKKGEILKALDFYYKAQEIDPKLEISAEAWNIVCWNGSLYGYATDVIDACEQAVENAIDDGLFHDSRGLARALTGQTKEAIEDFRYFITWIDNNLETMDYEESSKFSSIKTIRERWINELQNGKNPFTDQEIKKLFSE